MTGLVVYSTPTCHPCKAAKLRLDEDGIPYQAIDLTQDAATLSKLKLTLGTPTVNTPLFRWNGEYLSIADLPRIRQEALALQ